MSLLILIIIGVAVWYLLTRSSTGGGGRDEALRERRAIAARLAEFSARPEYAEESEVFLEISRALAEGRAPHPKGTAAASAVPAPAPAAMPAPPEPEHGGVSFDFMRNVNVLLFGGAFLVVVSALILIGASYDSLSGLSKFVLLWFGTLLFYMAGWWLAERPAMKPAAAAFLMTGIAGIPLLGAGAFRWLFSDLPGELFWLVSSLAALLAARLAAARVPHPVLASLVPVSFYSAAGAFITIGDASWAASGVVLTVTVLAIGLLRRTAVFVPAYPWGWDLSSRFALVIGLLLSFVPSGGEVQWIFVGSALLAAGANAMLETPYRESEPERHAYALASLTLLPLGLLALLVALGLGYTEAGLFITAVAASYVIAAGHLARSLSSLWGESLLQMSVAGGIAALVLTLGEPSYLPVVLGLLVVAYWYAFTLFQRVWFLALGSIGLALLPFAIIFGWFDLENEAASVVGSSALAILSVLHFLVRRHVEGLGLGGRSAKEAVDFLRLAYVLLLGAGLLLAFGAPQSFTLLYGLLTLSVAAIYTAYEGYLPGHYAVAGLAALNAMLAAEQLGAPEPVTAGALAASLLLYALGYYYRLQAWSEPWRHAGIGLAVLSVFSPEGALQVAGLALIGLLLIVEGSVRRWRELEVAGYGFVLLAAQWALWLLEVRELLAYTVPWALFFAAVSAWRERIGDRDGGTTAEIAALAVLTVPLSLQVLADIDGLRWLLLVSIAALLLIGGVAYGRDLVSRWGGAVILLVGAYQLRAVFMEVPQQFLLFAVGLGLLGAGIYFLHRKTEVER